MLAITMIVTIAVMPSSIISMSVTVDLFIVGNCTGQNSKYTLTMNDASMAMTIPPIVPANIADNVAATVRSTNVSVYLPFLVLCIRMPALNAVADPASNNDVNIICPLKYFS